MLRRALNLATGIGNKEQEAAAIGNLGSIYRTRGELDRAEDMYKRFLELATELGSKDGQAKANGNLGSLYQQKGDTSRACAYWVKARDLFREIGSPELEECQKLLREAGCPEA
jgi:tetratricopeptide (TPR) repeat protein